MTRNIDCLLFDREVENTFSMSENQNEKVDQDVIPVEEINMDSTTSDSDGEVILPPRRKKRRRVVFLDFKKVIEIFPELDTDVLCELSEMVEISQIKGAKARTKCISGAISGVVEPSGGLRKHRKGKSARAC